MRPVETQTATPETKDPQDHVARLKTWTVGIAAAILSWAAWTGLAERCGWHESVTVAGLTLKVSWLAALIVDIYALRAFSVWQRSAPWVSTQTRRYAKYSTFIALIVGILGNIAYHVMIVNEVTRAPLWVIIPVSSLPPAALGAIGFLNAIERRDRSTWLRTQVQTPAPETRKRTARPVPPSMETRTQDRIQGRIASQVSTAQTQETQETQTLETLAKVSGSAQVTHLAAIKAHVPGWRQIGGKVSYADITQATGLTGKKSLAELRAAMIADAESGVPDDARDLIGAH